jgi:hypothetical protein
MRAIIIPFIILFSFCNNPSQENESPNLKQDSTVDLPSASPIETCYWQVLKRDTFIASLVQNGNSITGKLSFDNFEKDGSSGSVTGRIYGDTIKLWYSFQSEGMHSVMEVWYKKQADALIRAVGPSGVKGDSSYFTDPSSIQFDPGQTLQKASCSEIPAKYK